jgi:1-acyl-sn-glycerol-3-phosphate acyltransferase
MNDSPHAPRRYRPMGGYGIASRLAAWAMRAVGWRIEVLDPLPDKCVIIVYPHTSNWDFPVGLFSKWATGLTVANESMRFAGKESLFRAPWGAFFRAVGGFPVNRSGSNGFVDQMTARFAAEPRLRFVLSPEGTRSYAAHMRSSFYFVAKAAGVPIILGALDFPGKRMRVNEVFMPTDDVDADLKRIDAYYQSLATQGALGCKPENAAPWVFREK